MGWREWIKQVAMDGPTALAGAASRAGGAAGVRARGRPVVVTPPPGDEGELFLCPLFFDRATAKSTTRGVVTGLHAETRRSIVAGQRILEVRTEIGLLPVRTKTNAFLIEYLVALGDEIEEGKPLWRVLVSKPM
jgi:hypothetical protein